MTDLKSDFSMLKVTGFTVHWIKHFFLKNNRKKTDWVACDIVH